MSYKDKNEKQKEEKELITVRIDRLVDKPDSSLLAIVSINIADSFAVHGLRLMKSDKGLFVAMPSTSFTGKDGKTQYSEIVHPISAVARSEMIDKVMEAYHKKIAEVQAAEQKGAVQGQIPRQ